VILGFAPAFQESPPYLTVPLQRKVRVRTAPDHADPTPGANPPGATGGHGGVSPNVEQGTPPPSCPECGVPGVKSDRTGMYFQFHRYGCVRLQ
jgi:hypothetical protein